jgi:hypothetical protein
MNSFGTTSPTITLSEFVACVSIIGLEPQLHTRELAGAAGLLPVRAIDLRWASQGLTIGHLRSADAHLKHVRAFEVFAYRVEMQVVGNLYDHPATSSIFRIFKRRLLRCHLSQGIPESLTI